MMEMDWIAPLIGGLGVGTLLTNVVNHFLSKKSEIAERLYQEKREAYLGMNRALYDSEIEPSAKTEKAFGLYLNMAKIFGSQEVVKAAHKIIDTSPSSRERIEALDELHTAMREDLL